MIDPNELDSRGRALLEHYQGAQAPSAEVSTRVWEAVSARAAAGELGPDLSEPGSSTSPAPSSTSSSALGLTSKIGLGVGAVVVVAALAVGLGNRRPTGPETPETAAPAIAEPGDDQSSTRLAVEQHRPAPRPATAEAKDASAAVESTKSEAEPAPSGDREADVEAPPGAPKPNPSSSRRHAADGEARSSAEENKADALKPEASGAEPSPELGPDLGPEVALMTKARAAMRAGRHAEALRRLDEHARRFPRGVFSSERELSRVTTLCGMDEREAATEAARRYLKRRPSARERLVKTCAGEAL